MKIRTEAIENYIKTIYRLCAEGGPVGTNELAAALNVSAASATHMIKKLAALELAQHSPYHGVTLTPAGERRALETLRHHRLIELFLAETLDVPWDQVHGDAERLEHVISEELEDRIAARLGDPATDPHGDPIPTKAGTLPAPIRLRVSDLAPGERAVIRRVGAQEPEHLRYLQRLGLVPGAQVELVGREPFEGPLTVRIEGREQTLSPHIAEALFVSRTPMPRPRARLPRARRPLGA